MSDITKLYEDEDKIEHEEDDINEDPTALTQESLPDDFCEHIIESKKKLYAIIVLGPKDENSAAAQDNTLLEKYIKELDLLGKALIKIIKNPTSLVLEQELKNYSSHTKTHINDTINYANIFVKNNSNINKMIYIDYINTQFSIYPFFQLAQLPYFPE